MSIQGLRFIGDRINPGFKSTRELIEAGDLEGLQALAVRQVEAGAWALDVNVGERAFGDPAYLAEIVRERGRKVFSGGVSYFASDGEGSLEEGSNRTTPHFCIKIARCSASSACPRRYSIPSCFPIQGNFRSVVSTRSKKGGYSA